MPISKSIISVAMSLALTAAMAQEPTAAQPESTDIRDRSRAAVEEFLLGNNQRYLELMQQLVADRPDFPRLYVNLAGAYVANDLPEEAVATLGQLADLGLYSAVMQSSDFAPIRDREDFRAVARRLDANLNPIGEGRIAFVLRNHTGLIESVAFHQSAGIHFFGDVHNRAVWTRSGSGQVTRFTPEDDSLPGVFGLRIDESTRTLWAAVTGRPEMIGYTDDHRNLAGIADINLSTGAVRRVLTVPIDEEDHVVGDLEVGRDGYIYATDSAAPVLWRFSEFSGEAERFVESPDFASLQGIVLMPDNRTLVVSDYVNGLLAIDLRSRSLGSLAPPYSESLVGIDSLSLAADGSLIAVQNGTRPLRVLRIRMNSTYTTVESVTVLESAHLNMGDPSLGAVAGNEFFFVANAGWSRFEPPASAAAEPRPVAVFRTDLGAEPRRN
jgi:sugar lactone lactonase YvrE